MSGTLINIYNNAGFALNLHTEAMARLQEQASTGSRINRASDEPSDAYQLLGLNSQKRSLDNYIASLSEIVSLTEFSSSVIKDIMSQLSQTRLRLTQVTGGIYGEDERQRVAEEIDDILERVVSLANARHMDKYLFGGSNTASAPYLAQYTDGKITSVTYQGSLETRQLEVAAGVRSSAFCVGEDIFGSDDRQEPVFLGQTGAEAGTGTSSVRGHLWLTVIHDGSNYKISIDDGASYTTVPAGGQANQAVTDSVTGRVLYVDTTGINSTGTELVGIPGTHDIFNTLITIRDIFANQRALPESQLQTLRDDSLQSLEELDNLLVQTSVSLGSRTGFLDNLKDSLENSKSGTEDEATRLEQADIAQIAIELSRHEVLYQMSLSVVARLMSMSLLDFIR